jgi:hypothetical protein
MINLFIGLREGKVGGSPSPPKIFIGKFAKREKTTLTESRGSWTAHHDRARNRYSLFTSLLTEGDTCNRARAVKP